MNERETDGLEVQDTVAADAETDDPEYQLARNSKSSKPAELAFSPGCAVSSFVADAETEHSDSSATRHPFAAEFAELAFSPGCAVSSFVADAETGDSEYRIALNTFATFASEFAFVFNFVPARLGWEAHACARGE